MTEQRPEADDAATAASSSAPAGPEQPYAGQPDPGQRPYVGQPDPGQQPYPGQPYPGQPYAGQPYAGQPYPGQPSAGQPYAGQPYPGQPYPGQPYPGQPYPGQPYAGQPYPGQPYRPPFPGVFQPPLAVPPMPKTAYSPWGKRVLASLIDFAPTILGLLLYLIGYVFWTTSLISDLDRLDTAPGLSDFLNPVIIVGLVILLAAVPWNIWNRWIRGGKTGQSLGKRVAGLTLVSEQTGAPTGAGMAFLRDLVHSLDGLAYVGYLWPLWDEKRQTFADKLMQTVVLPAGATAATPATNAAPTPGPAGAPASWTP